VPRSAREDGSSALDLFHAPVSQWFRTTLGEPTPAQTRAWPAIAAGRSTLLLAPTGSGKTLAAFLAAIDRLMFSPEPPAGARCRVLYISPLKALGVDIERNLRAPLAGIAAAATRAGRAAPRADVAVRSGDTPAGRARAAAATSARHPDHHAGVAVSAAHVGGARALPTSRRDRRRDPLAGRRQARRAPLPVARAARGAATIAGRDRPRCSASGCRRRSGRSKRSRGCSAGFDPPAARSPRPVEIVDAGVAQGVGAAGRHVEVPRRGHGQLGDEVRGRRIGGARGAARPVERSIWPSDPPAPRRAGPRAPLDDDLRQQPRLAERLAAAINDAAGEELALAHHGSLAREQRRMIEERLKAGDLPAIVATSSLELGIDIGAVDLVIQIEAPPSVARGSSASAARAIRSGRCRGGSCSRSSAAICSRARRGRRACARARSRRRCYPRNPLDVLAQQIVAMIARWTRHRRRAVRDGAPGRAVRRAAARRRSRACSTCCRGAIRRTSSRSSARASRGTAWAGELRRARRGRKRLAV
jgi:ATP-dependent Lhr-like helicase